LIKIADEIVVIADLITNNRTKFFNKLRNTKRLLKGKGEQVSPAKKGGVRVKKVEAQEKHNWDEVGGEGRGGCEKGGARL
jgi:hypothetical protein